MAWLTPTADDVLSEFTPTENAAISALMGDGSLDTTVKLSGVLTRVIAEVRDYIRSGGYALDPDDTKLPAGLINDAIGIARWRFLVSVPQFKQLQTDERKGAYTDAISKLKLVADQKFVPESPTDDDTANRSGNWNSEQKIIMRTHPTPPPSQQSGVTVAQPYANPNAPPDN